MVQLGLQSYKGEELSLMGPGVASYHVVLRYKGKGLNVGILKPTSDAPLPARYLLFSQEEATEDRS